MESPTQKIISLGTQLAFAGGLCFVLFLGWKARAVGSPFAYTFTQPAQTVLNPDGGPWVNVDPAKQSAATISNTIVQFSKINYSVGPLRLVHVPICLNPVGASQSECGQLSDPSPLTDEDVDKIDGYLQTIQEAHVKMLLRFAYNYSGAAGSPDAKLDVILTDIAKLSKVVAKHKNVIYALEAGFIGYWGEGHNSTHGNNTPAATKTFMEAEELAFGPFVTLLNRYPSNIMDWEPRNQVIWGIHDDHYAENLKNTWTYPSWSRFPYSVETMQHFGAARSDQKPFSVEIGGECPNTCPNPSYLQDYETFDELSRRFHLNAMDLTWNTDTLSENGHFPDIVNRVGPAIGLTSAALDLPPQPGVTSKLTLSFVNTGYSRLFTKVPVYVVLTDAEGTMLSDNVFRPILVPIDLTTVAGSGGTEFISTDVTFPVDLASDTQYFLALWIPDPDPALSQEFQYNYLLNNVGVPDLSTGLNKLFAVQWER